jgi:uncharacterized protein DUF4190
MTDYAAQPAQPPAARPGAGLAITALIFGILALLLFWSVVGGILFGLIALILGPIASGRAKRGLASGRGMAITGAILGLVGLLGSVAVGALFGVVFFKSGAKNYTDCVNDANGDKGKIQKCVDEFQKDLEDNN